MTTERHDAEETLAADGSAGRRGEADAEAGRGTFVGRYVVLSKLGAGGMGVVYAAYDPELDRKVAVKLLRTGEHEASIGSDGRTRLLREAQALAKLSHPNVVAVHDVGTRDDGVWLAMEFVEGQTLGGWLDERRRTWPEVVDVIVRAGRGLAAAHTAGLLHRDFKPDNVMVAVDGRVRVMDFGLARTGRDASDTPESRPALEPDVLSQSALSHAMTQTGAMMGTPAYMAPEQIRGCADERSDQFSLCVTLWEALYGERPFAADTLAGLVTAILDGELRTPPRAQRVPGWLRRVCVRGLSTDPAARFASVEALLDAIERGRARGRKVRVLGALFSLLVLAAGVEGARRWDRAEREAACEVAGASIDEVWNEAARERVRQGLLATRVGNAATTVDKVMPWIDTQADAWRAHRTDACMRAEVTQAWDAEIHERAKWCLEERRLDLASLVAELEAADARVLQSAVPAASALGSVSPCLDASVLEHLPPPPTQADRAELAELSAESARVESLRITGKRTEALVLLGTVRERAAAIGWPPFDARLRAQEAALLGDEASYEGAERAGVDAYLMATRAGAWGVAASAATRLVNTVGYRQSRHAEARLWARFAELAESFAGDPLHLREAARLGNLAAIEHAAGAYDEGIRLSERVLALRRATLGEEHPEIATTLANLAILYHEQGRYEDGEQRTRQALAILEATLGADHPEVARTMNNLGIMLRRPGSLAVSKAMIERALTIRERVLGPDHPDFAASIDSLGGVLLALGARDQARARYERALEIRERILGPEHPEDFVESLNNLANLHSMANEPELARPLYERALEVLQRTSSPNDRLIGIVAFNLGSIYLGTDDPKRAAEMYHEAIARLEVMGPKHEMIATVSSSLGRAYLDLERPADAIAPLERALAIVADASEGPRDDPETRWWLADAMLRAGRDRELAVAEARRARKALSHGPDEDAELRAAIDAWLATHERARDR